MTPRGRVVSCPSLPGHRAPPPLGHIQRFVIRPAYLRSRQLTAVDHEAQLPAELVRPELAHGLPRPPANGFAQAPAFAERDGRAGPVGASRSSRHSAYSLHKPPIAGLRRTGHDGPAIERGERLPRALVAKWLNVDGRVDCVYRPEGRGFVGEWDPGTLDAAPQFSTCSRRSPQSSVGDEWWLREKERACSSPRLRSRPRSETAPLLRPPEQLQRVRITLAHSPRSNAGCLALRVASPGPLLRAMGRDARTDRRGRGRWDRHASCHRALTLSGSNMNAREKGSSWSP